MDQILKTVAEYYGLEISMVAKFGRKKHNVRARQIYFYLCKFYYPENTLYSYANALYKCGDTLYDHTTVIHAIKVISNELDWYADTKKEISDLKLKLDSTYHKNDIVVKEVNLLSLCNHVIIAPKKYL